MANKIREIKMAEFPFTGTGYWLYDKYSPGILKTKDGYQIRIKTSHMVRGGLEKLQFDYFKLDSTGLIVESPRGEGKEYNRKVRIVDIAQAAAEALNEK
jgi:hypothetical protein